MGFSVMGLIIVALILVPNLFIIILPPKNTPKEIKDACVLVTVIERLGQAGCFILPVFSRGWLEGRGIDVWLVLMAVCIAVYWALWIRYAARRDFAMLFEPLMFIPVPMAVFPVLAFASAAVWARSPWLGIAAAALALGHIANSLHTFKNLKHDIKISVGKEYK